MNLHPKHQLLLLSVLGLVVAVCGAPRGPPSIHIAVKVHPHETPYTAWVDQERGQCVFEHYSLPLSTCIQLYGQGAVDTWPPLNPNPPEVMHSFPGANIG